MIHFTKLLMQSGLSEKESAVYLASLEQGPTTVLKLARETGLKRATVYSVVDALVGQGLMRIDEVGLKRKFVAEDPSRLKAVAEKTLAAATGVVPDLQALYHKTGKDKLIKTYEGKAALVQVMHQLMDQARHGDYRYMIGGAVGWRDVDPYEQEKFFTWRERIKLDAKLLFPDSDRAALHQQHAQRFRQEVKTLPKELELKSDITITPHMVVVEKITAPESAIVIEDADIIETYRALFLFMWNAA